MPTLAPTCPKCNTKNVKSVTIWRVAVGPYYITEPPLPMFACQELTCLHKWARQSSELTGERT